MAKRSKKKRASAPGMAATVAPAGAERDWIWALVLLAAVFLAYTPVWRAGFIWDDDMHVTANPVIVGPLGLKEIWTTNHARICPLALTTFWFEHALWGLAPLPYHLVNVLVHGLGAVVLWRVLRQLQIPGAWFGAALWALHPVQVETVAWITELKNTQSCLFYLLSILFFVKWLRAGKTGGNWPYALTLLFAAMAMASKSSTVILPLVLCLCAWWVEGRWQWRRLIAIAPIFLMSVAAALVSMWTQKLEGAGELTEVRSWPERLITAGDVVWFYPGKLAWPHPLIFIYPRWQIDAGAVLSYLPLAAAIIVGIIFWTKRATWGRPCFFALGYFVVALLPVLGLVDHYFLRYSFVGDHFQYLASIGPLALAGAGLAWLAKIVLTGKQGLQAGLCAALIVISGLMSWQRARVYQGMESLWTDTIAQNPDCWMAYNNLGLFLVGKGNESDAKANFQKSLEINPDNYDAQNNLGNVLMKTGQIDEALPHYQKAVDIYPSFAAALNNLGWCFSQKGRTDEAIVEFQKAVASDPLYTKAYNNLGGIFLDKGRVDDAIALFKQLTEIYPDDPEAHNNLGIALSHNGQLTEAISQFHEALRLQPDYGPAQESLTAVQAQAAQRTVPK